MELDPDRGLPPLVQAAKAFQGQLVPPPQDPWDDCIFSYIDPIKINLM